MTFSTPAPASTTPPRWPHCGYDATAEAPVGCRGILVLGYSACLAHLPRRKRRRYLAGLAPGADLDHRGTPLSLDLLGELLTALTDSTGRRRFGAARFDAAEFGGGGTALFNSAEFGSTAGFHGAKFRAPAWFGGAKFGGPAKFSDAEFGSGAVFDEAEFGGDVNFGGAKFGVHASFGGAKFGGRDARVGPLVCAGTLELSRAVFQHAVTLEVAAATVRCRRTRWSSTAALRLRHAIVDLSDAVLEHPVSISAHSQPFTVFNGELAEPGLTDPRVRVVSLRGVDTTHLVLTDIDLTECRFAGAIHLDQLGLEGRITFARPPKGWSRRRTLADEQHWRAAAAGRPVPGEPPSKREWEPGPNHPNLERTPGPQTVAALYRQLRKALEDAKNEPGAADFYYGECEMRHHDDTGTPWAERALLKAYWAVSGYGLRAYRALIWLLLAVGITILVMMLWGIPPNEPKPTTTGRQVSTGQDLTLVTDTPDPANPTGALTGRLTTDRFEKSLRTVANSVVFRSSSQDLTTVGTYTEMASRFAEPVLLGLAILAIRNRVKR
ncbi:pentapeptide repeat-containing protein [Streptomyces platensis]|uniref:pentapeptide repeat-containing protein n=1 Tax=Streptomyces platensis TaxID=58346 RepID=UPI00386F5F1D|nr:pentapeptide repeat-containing protein [Streptomyces platensis]